MRLRQRDPHLRIHQRLGFCLFQASCPDFSAYPVPVLDRRPFLFDSGLPLLDGCVCVLGRIQHFYHHIQETESRDCIHSQTSIQRNNIRFIISRLPGCDGKAADAVSAYTQVKMEDAHKLLKIPKSECPDIWIRLPRHKWPKSWSSMEDPVVPLERNLYGHPLAGLLWRRQFEEVPLGLGWEKELNWESPFVHREKGLFLSVYVDDIKLAGKKHNIDPMWKVLNKEVDLGEPTSFLDHVYLGCTQRQC